MDSLEKTFKYYAFYDLETSGMNPAFDQILQFAAIKTDLDFNEIERYEFKIKLREDVIPHPGALIVNRLNVEYLLDGINEYEATKKMHSILSSEDTVNLGYNTISFDDEFMRFAYDRNLLNPYSNQNNLHNCARMDVMPITILYFLYEKSALKWPIIDEKPSLRLEHLNSHNNLAQGMAHDALVDVEATIELAKLLKKENKEMWNYLCRGFDKNIDSIRLNELEKIQLSDGKFYSKGLFFRNKFGYKNNCVSQCIKIAEDVKLSKTFWLRLDTKIFSAINEKRIISELRKSTISRKTGVPDFILPMSEKYNVSSAKKKELYFNNEKWIKSNPQFIRELSNHFLNVEYDEREYDLDASLYPKGAFHFNSDKKKVCDNFHKITDLFEKNTFVENIPYDDVRSKAIRLLGRNYYNNLTPALKREYDAYIQSTKEEIHIDASGKKRNTIEVALNETRSKLDDISTLDQQQVEILKSFEMYLLNK